MKLAEALLLRKQLSQKVDQLRPIKMAGDNGLLELKSKRVKMSDDVDEVRFEVPKITLADLTKTYDHYATQLRKLDASIQKVNWETEVDFTEEKAPEVKESK